MYFNLVKLRELNISSPIYDGINNAGIPLGILI